MGTGKEYTAGKRIERGILKRGKKCKAVKDRKGKEGEKVETHCNNG